MEIFLRGVWGWKREIMSKEKLDVVKKKWIEFYVKILIINIVVYMYMYNVVVYVCNLYVWMRWMNVCGI